LINTVIKPVNEYGLSSTYGRELFCLLSRTCVNMFSWEIEKPSREYLLITLDNIERYRSLLKVVDVKDEPELFFTKLKKSKDLPLVYPTPGQLIEIAELRLLQWKKHHRGRLSGAGGRIRVQFKSSLTKEQDDKLTGFLEALYGNT